MKEKNYFAGVPVTNITIIAPLYNEAEVFAELKQRLDALIASSSYKLQVLLIDDGSTDNTALLMEEAITGNENYSGLFLSKNFGHGMALTAGLAEISNDTDAVFIIDGDLQDPPELLPQFINKMNEGYDVVYGIRNNRKEGFLKKQHIKCITACRRSFPARQCR